MRIHIRLLFACLVAAGWPVILSAQFQEPTSDELKMTSDPKAPGAAAVYLNREEKTDDLIHFHSYYARIKVLTEKGKDLATVQIPYEKGKFQVAAIQGRTIHSDGTQIRLTSKPADLLDFKNAGHQFNQMVFTLPGVEVGSILEYSLQLRYSEDSVSAPDWIIQQPYFIHKAHYYFVPDFDRGNTITNSRGEVQDGLMYSSRLGLNDRVVRDTLHRYSLDLTDIPALSDDDWTPPLNTIRYSVHFYYTNANSGPEYWAKEGHFWARDADRFASPSGAIKSAASGIVSSGDSDDTKARKLYAAVMKLKNSDYIGNSNTGSRSTAAKNKDASSVWKQQAGSSNDIALLYVALARAAGLKAWPMQVIDRDVSEYEATFLSMTQFDDYIAIVEIGGKEVYLDPGEKLCPYGILYWAHELTSGMRLTSSGASIEKTPAIAPSTPTIQRTADLTIDDKGNLQGSARIALNGQEAIYWRQVAQVNDTGEFRKRFNESFGETLPDGVQADFDHFEALEDFSSDLVATAKLTGTLGSVTGKRLILPGLFFEARAKYPFTAQEDRKSPIDLHYATMEQDQTIYHLPAGFNLDSSPQATNVEWTGYGSVLIRSAAKDASITITRAFTRRTTLLDADSYENLRFFYCRMSQADQQQVVLSPAEAHN